MSRAFGAPPDTGGRLLQALIEEAEFNTAIASLNTAEAIPAHHADDQFLRAMRTGAMTLLPDGLAKRVRETYALARADNQTMYPSASLERLREGILTVNRRARGELLDGFVRLASDLRAHFGSS